MKKRDPYGEQASAKRKGGRAQLNSGRHWFAKGDMIVDQDLIDRKETIKLSYRLSLLYWLKLREQAIRIGKSPAYEICFKDIVHPEESITVVVIPEDRYRELLELAGTAEEGAKGRTVGEEMQDKQERLHGLLSALKQEGQRGKDNS